MSILCIFGHDWWQYPAGSPKVASYPSPIGECRRCGATDWVFNNAGGMHDKIFPAPVVCEGCGGDPQLQTCAKCKGEGTVSSEDSAHG